MNLPAPRIIDPSRPQLPLMQSIHDAAKLNEKDHTTFYVSLEKPLQLRPARPQRRPAHRRNLLRNRCHRTSRLEGYRRI